MSRREVVYRGQTLNVGLTRRKSAFASANSAR